MATRTHDDNDRCVSCGAPRGTDHDPDCILGLFENGDIYALYEECVDSSDGPSYYKTRRVGDYTTDDEGTIALGTALARAIGESRGKPGDLCHRRLLGDAPVVYVTLRATANIKKVCADAFTHSGGHLSRMRDLKSALEKAEQELWQHRKSAELDANKFVRERHLLNEAGIQDRRDSQKVHTDRVKAAMTKVEEAKAALEKFRAETGL